MAALAARFPLFLSSLFASGSLLHAQCELQALGDLSDPFEGGQFGREIAADGGRALVGAPTSDSAAHNAGAVLFFDQVGLNWVEVGRFVSPVDPGGDRLGSAVALEGELAVAGAPSAAVQGRVTIYERTGGGWTPVQSLQPTSTQFSIDYGSEIALEGDTLVVAAPRESGSVLTMGRVYVYERVGGSFELAQVLEHPQPQAGEQFGAVLDLRGDLLAVGLPVHDGVANQTGRVSLFRKSGGSWAHELTFASPLPDEFEQFGNAVEVVDSDCLVVGTPLNDELGFNAGKVYVYAQEAGDWGLVQELLASDGATQQSYGRPLVADGQSLFVGSTGREDGKGAVYEYERTNGSYAQVGIHVPLGAKVFDGSGSAIAVDGDLLHIGMPGHDELGEGAGEVQVLSRSGSQCQTMESFPIKLSLSNGGTKTLLMRGDFTLAGHTFLCLGSVSGIYPGLPFADGVLPLVPDAYFELMLSEPNSAAFVNTLGTLSATGKATAQVHLPPVAAPQLVGTFLYHAFVSLAPDGAPSHASTWVRVLLDA